MVPAAYCPANAPPVDSEKAVKGVAVSEEVPDGGIKAWSVVLGCFILAGCQMGYGTSWGVLMQDLHTTRYTSTSLSKLSLIGGVSNFLSSAGSLAGGRLGEKYGYKRMVAIGIVSTYISLVLSAVVPSLALLFVFQGAALGLSFAIGMPIYMALPSQWFARRRGLATGIAVSGSGFGGGIGSLIIRGLLPHLGYQNTLIVYASINLVFSCLAWFLLRVRGVPNASSQAVSPGGSSAQWLPAGVWKSGVFYSFLLCYFIGTFGLWSPQYYIASYTTYRHPQLDPTSLTPAIPVVVGCFGIGLGRIGAGRLADWIGPLNSILMSLTLGAIFQISMWPLTRTYGSILAFSILNAITGSWTISLLPVASSQLFGTTGLATITGAGVLASAPGQFIGATIGGAVLEVGGWGPIAYYSGAMGLGGAVTLLYARFCQNSTLWAKD